MNVFRKIFVPLRCDKQPKRMRHLSLYELNTMVKEAVELSMAATYWVEAELSDVSERRGHLFMELVQKDERMNTPVARASAKCWASTWNTVRYRFMQVTGSSLCSGMKVLLEVYPQFHQAYGFSWIVTDIDPTYTLGDLARRRQEIIATLKEEGVFDLQKQLHLPMFCQHIAVISSETAAGYGDFCNQLANNEYGFKFHAELFPAVMQGEQVEESIINALNKIYELTASPSRGTGGGPFEAVVIIRGGGATTDMSGFDTLALAENVANFPIPIITGIGHDRDECILDMVSHTRVKTPTAAAAFLIDHLAGVYEELNDLTDRIGHAVRRRIETERVRLTGISTRLPMLFSLVKTKETSRFEQLMQRCETSAGRTIEREHHRLEMLSQRTASLDPQLVLRRGYSMTLSGGRVVTSADDLIDGEIIETRLSNGQILSKVWKKQ